MAPSEQIKVYVRVRKLLKRELGSSTFWKCEEKDGFKDEIWSHDGSKRYTYDRVFSPEEDNFTVYNEIGREVISSALNGFNTTIFAYGQTGSGKTHTMLGGPDNPGFIQRAVSQIFESIPTFLEKDFLLRVSYMEIYNEQVTDLLSQDPKNLQVKDDLQGNVYVEDLQEIVIMESQQLFELMEEGEKNRHFGQTNMNERSSRSHTIFRIIIESAVLNEHDGHGIMVSHLNLVDLAGSERSSQTGAVGERFREGVNINKSLMTLGQVISKLSEGCTDHIPFRDSKLTRILKNSLGGNAKTSIISTITPCELNQTKSTLDFASRAKKITQHAKVNEILDDRAKMKRMHENIEVLTTEKQILMEQLAQQAERDNDRVRELQEKLAEKEKLLLEQKNQFCSSYFNDMKSVKKQKMISRRQTWCPEMSRPRSSLARPLSIQDDLSFKLNEDIRGCLKVTKSKDEVTSDEDTDISSRIAEQSSFVTTKRQRKTVHFQQTISEEVFFPDEEPAKVEESFCGTPKSVLRQRNQHLSQELEELREFTRLEDDLKIHSNGFVEFENELLEKNIEIERLSKELLELQQKHESIKNDVYSKSAKEVELQANMKHFQNEVDKLWQEKHDLQSKCRRSEELLTISQSECQEIKSDLLILRKTLGQDHEKSEKEACEGVIDLQVRKSSPLRSKDIDSHDFPNSEGDINEPLCPLLLAAKALNKTLLAENKDKDKAIRELQDKMFAKYDAKKTEESKKSAEEDEMQQSKNVLISSTDAGMEVMRKSIQDQNSVTEELKTNILDFSNLNETTSKMQRELEQEIEKLQSCLKEQHFENDKKLKVLNEDILNRQTQIENLLFEKEEIASELDFYKESHRKNLCETEKMAKQEQFRDLDVQNLCYQLDEIKKALEVEKFENEKNQKMILELNEENEDLKRKFKNLNAEDECKFAIKEKEMASNFSKLLEEKNHDFENQMHVIKNQLSEIVEENQVLLSKQQDAEKQYLEKIEAERLISCDQILSLEKKLQDFVEENENLKLNLDVVHEKEDEVKLLQNKIESLVKDKESYMRSENVEGQEHYYDDLKKEIENLNAEAESKFLHKEKELHSNFSKLLEEKCHDYENQIHTIQNELSETAKENKELLSKLHDAEKQYLEKTEAESLISCDKILTLEKKLQDLVEENENLKSNLKVLREKEDEVKVLHNKIESLLEEKESHLRSQCNQVERNDYEALKKKIDDLNAEAETKLANKEEELCLNFSKLLEEKNQEFENQILIVKNQLSKTIEENQSILSKLHETEKQYLEKAEADRLISADQISSLEKKLQDFQKENENLKLNLSVLHEKEDEVKILKNQIESLVEEKVSFKRSQCNQEEKQNYELLKKRIENLDAEVECKFALKEKELKLNFSKLLEEMSQDFENQIHAVQNQLIKTKDENCTLVLKLQTEENNFEKIKAELLISSDQISSLEKKLQESMNDCENLKSNQNQFQEREDEVRMLQTKIQNLIEEKEIYLKSLSEQEAAQTNEDQQIGKMQNHIIELQDKISELESSQAASSIRQLQVRATNDRIELADLRVKLRQKEEELKAIDTSLTNQLESERAAVRRLKEELRRHQTSVDKSFVATGSKNQQTEERKPLAEVQPGPSNNINEPKKKESFQDLMAKYENGHWSGGSGTVKEIQLDLLKQRVKDLEKQKEKLKAFAANAEEFQRQRTTQWKTIFYKLKIEAEKCDNCKSTVACLSESLKK